MGQSPPVTRRASAKINLGLRVLCRRPDGYHDLETVFYRIPWADTVTAHRSDGITLTCSDPRLEADGSNLVMRAARALAAACNPGGGAALRLEKRLPWGAGLGGGSSDAAATLRLLVDLWDLSVPEAALHALARELGSDVPCFLAPPVAYATGRGEHLAPMPGYVLPYPVVVVAPSVRLSTAEAFAGIQPRAARDTDLRALVLSNDLRLWRDHLKNDFEATVFGAHPAIAEAKASLMSAGAGYASLTGTGSAVYGIFEDLASARTGRHKALQSGHTVWGPHVSA